MNGLKDTIRSRIEVLFSKECRILLISLVAGLLIRLILMPITSSPFDIAEGWAAIIDSFYGGDDLYSSGWYLYPPIWGYILSIVGYVAQLFGMASFGDVFALYPRWMNVFGYNFVTSLGFNFLVKIPALLFDLATAYLCYLLGMHLTSDRRKASVCTALWFCSPVSIMSTAILGMFDSIIIFLTVLSILTFFEKRYLTTGMLLALGGLTKFFPLMLLPVFGGYVLSDRSQPMKGRIMPIVMALIGMAVIFLLVYLPVLSNGQFADSLTFITDRADKASAGFDPYPSFNNISYYIPVLVIAYLAMFLAMFFIKEDREKALIWLLILTYVPVFSLPLVGYTPTYGIVLVPATILLYCFKGRIAMIPWVALFIFPLHGIAHYWGQMFYPLGAFTGLVDLSSLPQIIQPYFFYDLFVYTMCISGISIIAVFVYCIRKHTLLDGDIDV